MEKAMEFEKLNYSNWVIWKILMQDYLMISELSLPLMGLNARPIDMKDHEWELLDRKCLATLRLSISSSILHDVYQCKTARELWITLGQLFEQSSRENDEQTYEQSSVPISEHSSGANSIYEKMYVIKQLFLLKMKEDISMETHVNEFNSITARLEFLGVNLDEDVLCLLLLNSLPISWVTTITNTLENQFKVNDVIALLMNEDSGEATEIESIETDAVGLDDSLFVIQNQLHGGTSRRLVIPIVGMGGIGKTTLARKVYENKLTRETFDIGGWVSISQSYDVENVIRCLLKSLIPFNSILADYKPKNDEEIEDDSVKLHKTLYGRKYMIVLDDMWDTTVWDSLQSYLPDTGNGSRVMLTTRLLDVAACISDCSPHHMQLLTEDQSWDLFRENAFREGIHHKQREELEVIGKAIARSCGGLPLAIVVIAGLLSTVKQTPASWEKIRKRVSSEVDAEEGKIEKILSLSYTHLPPHLRQCFLYMGGFRWIRVEKMYRLWIAEGLVGGNCASKTLEEEAEGLLEDLIRRNLVFVDERKPGGEIRSCTMHDLLRALCMRKANEGKFHRYNSLETFGDLEDLRVVDETCRHLIRNLSIQEMSSLRYVVWHDFEKLHGVASFLKNLQTLIIDVHGSAVHLPPEIWKMQELRHLVSFFEGLPCPLEPTSCPLENLQTLSKVSNQECSYRLVKMIPNIKKLRLVYSGSYALGQLYHLDNLLGWNQIENWKDNATEYDYCLKNLKWLQRLENLKVNVLPGFQGILNPVFPHSLKKLSLSGWRLIISWSDMSIVGSLPNLQVLKLRGFGGQDGKWETSEGEFGQLSFLLMERSDLRDWVTESEHFPKLKRLLIHNCWHLREIPKDMGDINTLELIEVKQGSPSLVESARLIEEEQKELANDNLQVRCI